MASVIDQVADDWPKKLEKATSLLQALKITGVKLRRDKDGLARANCPFPAHAFRSPSLVIRLSEPEHFRCEVCGVTGGVRTYIEAFCAPPPGSLPINLFIATAVEAQVMLRQAARMPSWSGIDCEIAADEQVTEVYEALLYQSKLFDYHFEYLRDRGLSAYLCDWNEYRSLPASRERRLEICENLMADNYCLEGIPGFFQISETAPNPDLRGRWCLGGDDYGRRIYKGKENGLDRRYEVGGILIPVRNSDFRITRFEILNDLPDSDAPARLKALWPPRLSLLSWPGQRGSELTGIARLHQVGLINGEGDFGDVVWVTDSALRADILYAVFGARALGVTGFDQLWGEIIEAIADYQRVIVALGREEILCSVRLCREAAKYGVEAFVASWERQETFDDYDLWLPTDYWNPMPYERWWSCQPPEIRERVEAQLLALP